MLLVSVAVLMASTSAVAGTVTAESVEQFLRKNKSFLLLEYSCPNAKNAKALTATKCRVVCSSGGSKFLEAESVNRAYYAERVRKLDGAVAGFYLIIDSSLEQQDVWATLQSESSCYFQGMSPTLREIKGLSFPKRDKK